MGIFAGSFLHVLSISSFAGAAGTEERARRVGNGVNQTARQGKQETTLSAGDTREQQQGEGRSNTDGGRKREQRRERL